MPRDLVSAMRSNPESQWSGFNSATMLVRNGFPVLPCTPGEKVPLNTGEFLPGAKSATTNYEHVRDAFLAHPEANVGLAPDGRLVIVDIDPRNGGSLEKAEQALGMKLDGYREITPSGGYHVFLMMPPGVVARRSHTIAPGIEIKALGTYAVTAAGRLRTGGVYAPEPGRNVWTWPVVPAGLDWLSEVSGTPERKSDVTILAEDRRRANEVLQRLRAGRQADQIEICLGAKKGSRSDHDFALAVLAYSELVDLSEQQAERTVVALLLICSQKAGSRRSPLDYAQLTARKAREQCARTSFSLVAVDPQAAFVDHLHAVSNPPAPRPPKCDDGTFPRWNPLYAGLWNWICASDPPHQWAGEAGWVRIPVTDFAEKFRRDRRTVTRHLTEFDNADLIERKPIPHLIGKGKFQCDSWVRRCGEGVP